MEAIRPIQAELLAAKIEKIHNFEYPDLLEQFGNEPELLGALWFLQFVSLPAHYPGGLGRFTSEFIAAHADRLGTAQMAKSKPKAGRYALTDAIAIFRELSDDARSSLFGGDAYLIENEFIPSVNECWSDYGSSLSSLIELEKKPLGRRECKSLLIDPLTPRAV